MVVTPSARKKSHNVVAVSADRTWLQALVRAMSAVPDLHCQPVDMAAFRDGKFDRNDIDAMVLDIDDGAALSDERLFKVRQDAVRGPLVVVSTQLAHDLARQVIRLGSADWLQKPVDHRQIVEAVAQLVRVTRVSNNRVYAVMSCVGGAGGSTLAIAAAHMMGRLGKGGHNHCALIDLDFTKGSCGAYLDLQNEADLSGVVDSPSRVDAEFMDLVRRDYRDLFSVFSFSRPEIAYAPTGEEFVLRMMDVLSYQYRNTVIDVPYHYTPWRDRIFEVADGIILATQLTIPAIRQAQVVNAAIKARRKADQNVVIVINRHRSRLFTRGISRKDIARTFTGTALHFLPDDWDTMSDAVNRGVAVSDAAPRSSFVKRAAAAIERMRAKEVV